MSNQPSRPHHRRVPALLVVVLGLTWWLSSAAYGESDNILDVSREMMKLQKAGKYSDALPLGRRALQLSEETLGPEHPTVAIYIENLGSVYQRLGEGEKAESLFRRALGIRERMLGPEHPAVATSLARLVTLYHEQRRHAEEEPLLVRAVSITEKTLGPSHPNLVPLFNQYADLLQATDRSDVSREFRRRASSIRTDARVLVPSP